MKPKTILSFAPAVIFIIVLLQNMDEVDITFLLWHTEMPKLVLMILMMVIGIIAGWFIHMSYRKYKQTQKQNLEVQANEINNTENE